jgi:hypothetical protein
VGHSPILVAKEVSLSCHLAASGEPGICFVFKAADGGETGFFLPCLDHGRSEFASAYSQLEEALDQLFSRRLNS